MLITVVPASTKTGSAVIRSILANPPSGATVDIQAVYRKTSKALPEFTSNPRFTAVQGGIDDPASLDLTGSDVVVAVTPPVFESGDMVALTKKRSENVKTAIEKSGTVKKLVLLSSVGAQFSRGVGEIKTNNMAERVFATTSVPEIIFVRCAYFMENWTMSLDTLAGPEPFFYSTITPLEWRIPMVAVEDIGHSIAHEALKQDRSPSKPYVFELYGPRWYTPLDVQVALSDALGKQVAVKPVAKSELRGFYEHVFPADIAGEYIEMATSFLEGGVMKPGEVEDGTEVMCGKVELGDAMKQAVAPLMSA
ncbi:hypothetical protein QQS21_003530 [Conoideocrella luteorostrata]|uniref:NAD(P)-binding domain-containing protein n=1 Tax=Conoideocrella luteorostrata TaxID=1105319 RepID=A0AAJ0CW20_9HYPO|nr:hypothetical protein QQS21_003530 [Conoideocrella luteorostrata]